VGDRRDSGDGIVNEIVEGGIIEEEEAPDSFVGSTSISVFSMKRITS
jgi:hypothetical protein